MRPFPILCLVGACAATPVAGPPEPPRRAAVVVSIDGLMPDAVLAPEAHGLRIPVLRALVAGARVARPGATPVFPTVTYPNHTSMVTGRLPAAHGVVTNVVFDPEDRNQDGWFWYASDIRARTLWDAAAERGLRTALVSWPVTVGARATALLPEYWRAGSPDDVKLVTALASPGLVERTAARFPAFRAGFTPPAPSDRALTDAALVAYADARPALALIHIAGVDDAEHAHGPFSPEALAAIEEADAQLGRIVEAVRAAGAWERTLLVVVSDHGFQACSRALAPGVVLAGAGLLDVDAAGKVVAWRAAAAVEGGSAYIHARDADAAERARAALAGREGVARVLDAAAIRERGGDPSAAFAIEAAEGWELVPGVTGEARVPAPSRGTHGFDADRPSMRATLLLRIPGVAAGTIAGARLVDVGPTVAAWLGLDLGATDGRSLLP
jgi:predicted AlkP superfamily pyrophosphatase or phosphodiesterase